MSTLSFKELSSSASKKTPFGLLVLFGGLMVANYILLFLSALLYVIDDFDQAFCLLIAAPLLMCAVFPLVLLLMLRSDSLYWTKLTNKLATELEAVPLAVAGSESLSSSHSCSIVEHSNIIIESEIIGSGATACVYKGLLRDTATPIAVKSYGCYFLDEEVIRLLLVEASIQQNLSHPNILQCFGVCVEPPTFLLLLEWAEEGSLEEFIERSKQTHIPHPDFELENKIRLLVEIASGMMHLHSCSVLHRDLKPQNVLIAGGHAKVCDFGTAVLLKSIRKSYSADSERHGTPAFMAPELIDKTGDCSFASDVYSYGVLMCQLISEQPPWRGGGNMISKVRNAMCNGETVYTEPFDFLPDDNLKTLASSTLHPLPKNRPAFAMIKETLEGSRSKESILSDIRKSS